jgi:hypothetical protein
MIERAYRAIVFGICPVLLNCLIINAQQGSASTSSPPTMLQSNLPTRPGKLLTAGNNRVPAGVLKVITYRLEEVPLPEPLTIDDGASKIVIENAVRLTVVLDQLQGDQYSIWINDDGYSAVRTNENEITAVIIGTQPLENGASITVKRGVGCQVKGRSTLPERLSVPKRLRSDGSPIDPRNFVTRIHSVPGGENIELDLVTSVNFPVRNAPMVFQIGDQEFEGGARRLASYKLRFTIPADAFARAHDGDVIKVKYAPCSLWGVKFGRLEKGLLNR